MLVLRELSRSGICCHAWKDEMSGEPTVTHGSFVIERSYPVAPRRVFAAFSDPSKKRRWFADEDEGEIEEFEMDFRVGGWERRRSRMGPNTPFAGTPLTNETVYQDIVPDRRIVIAYTMALGEKRISASLATFEFLTTQGGTLLVFTEQAAFFEGAEGPKMREQGWRELLESLGRHLSGV
jgi:uncharacterized protein YndB with AHSA1/START domain